MSGSFSAFAALAAHWRSRADALRRYGAAEGPARAWEEAATDLERALEEREDECLTLTEASAESGYSADHLGRLVRAGEVPNSGRAHAPRIRRGDLPRKQAHLRASGSDGELSQSSRMQAAQSIVTRS